MPSSMKLPVLTRISDIIMKDAEDLVEIVHLLRQFVNVKGD